MMPPEIIKVEGLTKIYLRCPKPVRAVSDITFPVHQGEIVGLLGPNGAGKTTIIKCLCGLLRLTSGNVSLNGIDVLRHPNQALRQIAAVLEGNRNVYWRLTVRENLDFFAALHGISRRARQSVTEEVLTLLHLNDKADTPARMLSRGMQQKLAIACALAKQTPILLLDEPTLGLDVEISNELRGILLSLSETHGRTILLSSHDMSVVQEVCGRVLILNDGHLVTDRQVKELLALWQRSAYRLRFKQPLSCAQLTYVKHALDATAHLKALTEKHLDVELTEADRLYDVMTFLREVGLQIEAVEHQEIDLEKAFLATLCEQRREAAC